LGTLSIPLESDSESSKSAGLTWEIVVPIVVAVVVGIIVYAFWRKHASDANLKLELLSEIELADEIRVALFTNGEVPLDSETGASIHGSPSRGTMFPTSSDDELL
jgi:hypothetical protein